MRTVPLLLSLINIDGDGDLILDVLVQPSKARNLGLNFSWNMLWYRTSFGLCQSIL